jgi:DNA-binding transcriptional LysR family regulator
MALALERHSGRAADQRHIAAPTLSKHIQRLERQVGPRSYGATRRA